MAPPGSVARVTPAHVVRRTLTLSGVRSGARRLAAHELSSLPSPSAPPPKALLRLEPLGWLESPRLLPAAPRLARVPRGDGRVVIDVPGWKAPEVSMAPLRRYLDALGWDARPWGRGWNQGDTRGDVVAMLDVVRRAADESGRPVSLVGWSLGGVISREVARELPSLVDRVVTFGSPIVGGPSYTIGARSWGEEVSAHAAEVSAQRERERPITVPVTAIFSKRDGIVTWSACLDRTSPDVTHVEVGSTHVGMGWDPDVWEVVARALAR